jgi:translation initiation factor 1
MSNSRLVYSSELGRLCPGCGNPVASCQCRQQQVRPTSDGVVRVRRETKGRGGKTVTVITGLPGDDAAIKSLAGDLKKRCGTGGTCKDGVVEIQGDHADLLVAELQKKGFSAKRAGG